MDAIETVLQRLEKGNIPVQRMVVKENQVFTLTARELLAICAKNPNHPFAEIFRGAVTGCPPDEEHHVDRVDLEALIANKSVNIEIEQSAQFIDGVQKLITTERKVLADEKLSPRDSAAHDG